MARMITTHFLLSEGIGKYITIKLSKIHYQCRCNLNVNTRFYILFVCKLKPSKTVDCLSFFPLIVAPLYCAHTEDGKNY